MWLGGANGNLFLDSQEFGPKLDIETTRFMAIPEDKNKVRVRFNVFPEMKDPFYDRELTYAMKKESGLWVIDDIFFSNGMSAKEMIEKENISFSQK